MRRFLLSVVVLILVLINLAATGPSESTAIAIASIAALALPLILKYVPIAGHYMVGFTLGASFLIAVSAELFSGEIVLSNLRATDMQAILGLFLSVWGLSQIVYATLTQSPKTQGAVV